VVAVRVQVVQLLHLVKVTRVVIPQQIFQLIPLGVVAAVLVLLVQMLLHLLVAMAALELHLAYLVLL
jgi:hypothetical protein